MAKRPTSGAWALLAYRDNPVARTYRLSEAGRRERVERMKRLNADPIFAARRDATSGERMMRLHADPADPVFAAKQAAAASEAVKRLNADTTFFVEESDSA
jgi:DNA-binding PadR family transcriptional regulator